jgi:hypothetical protein
MSSFASKSLCLCFRCDQHLVGKWNVVGGDAEQRAEGGMASAASVEAEDELVEVGLQMPAPQAVIDAQGPDFEVGEDAVRPRQDNMGGHFADHMRIMG